MVDFVQKMSNGIPILGTITKKCKLEKINSNTFKIILTQGLNRQIRRMCEYLDYEVLTLRRVRIMNIPLDVPIGNSSFHSRKKKFLQCLIEEGDWCIPLLSPFCQFKEYGALQPGTVALYF